MSSGSRCLSSRAVISPILLSCRAGTSHGPRQCEGLRRALPQRNPPPAGMASAEDQFRKPCFLSGSIPLCRAGRQDFHHQRQPADVLESRRSVSASLRQTSLPVHGPAQCDCKKLRAARKDRTPAVPSARSAKSVLIFGVPPGGAAGVTSGPRRVRSDRGWQIDVHVPVRA